MPVRAILVILALAVGLVACSTGAPSGGDADLPPTQSPRPPSSDAADPSAGDPSRGGDEAPSDGAASDGGISLAGSRIEGYYTIWVATSESEGEAPELPQATSVQAGPGGEPLVDGAQVDQADGADQGEWVDGMAHTLAVEARGGVLSVVLGCARVDLGTFVTAGDAGGSWAFTAAEWPEPACPDETVPEVRHIVDLLGQADTWALGDAEWDGALNMRVIGPGVVYFSGYPTQAPFPEPVADPGDPAEVAGLWTVREIAGVGGEEEPSTGPYSWIVTIGDGRVTVPQGCNTGRGAGYVADPRGYWALALPSVMTEMACIGEADESEITALALGQAVVWELADEMTLTVTGTRQQVTLVRVPL
jgi:hypothetical protein